MNDASLTDAIARMFRGDALDERVEQTLEDALREVYDTDRVSSEASAEALLERFGETAIPDGPGDIADYYRYLASNVVPHGINVASPRFIGHMTAGLPSFAAPIVKLLTVLNQNVVKMETSKVFTFHERQTIAMLHRLVYARDEAFYEEHAQNSESTLGMLVSGGTLGNIASLWCARNRALPAAETQGLGAALASRSARRAVVVAPALVHYSVLKAVGILGLGQNGLLRVPVDVRGHTDLDALRSTLVRCRDEGDVVVAVLGIAGATETGSVDRLDGIADVAAEHGVHFHVDAAWGGPVLFSRRHRDLLRGIERADSVTIDAHKQLYLPVGLGLALFREPDLCRAIELEADYIIRRGSWDLGRRALEGSRPGTSLVLHAGLHILGRRGYELLVDEGVRKIRWMADAIRARPELELLAEPTLNILVYRYLPKALRERAGSAPGTLSDADHERIDQVNRTIQERQRDAAQGFISRTTLRSTRYGSDRPIVCLRSVVANPLTTERDIAAVLDEQLEIASALEGEPR